MLCLFDIDGTLLLSGGAGLRALDGAFQELYGVTVPSVQAHGKTDPLIVQELFQEHLGRSPAPEEIDRVLDRYLVHLTREVPLSQRFEIMPGAPEAVQTLADLGFCLGLATGNVREGARLKMERANLWNYFPFGGFGCDSGVRAELVQRAIERGQAHARRSFPPDEIWIIGDTPLDVAAARACGVRVLAVATGRHSVAHLEAAGADLTLRTLKEIPRWLSLIN